MRLTTKLIALIIILLSVAAPVFAATNLLENADFETSMIANLIPGWVVFTGRIGVDMLIEPDKAYDGESALVFHITDTEQRTGLRSSPILAVPNGVYEAGVYVYDATSTRVFLYLDFWNSNQQRIAHKTIATTAKNQWEELRVRLTAPEDALFVSIILYNTSGNLGSAYFDHAWLYLVDE
ncbi:MAG TPA: hypothetical protein GXZ82_08010 [Firmicutes bacterium]|jgi:hypothetical protein|nr:hypothetical protein [Bacillota bacterium]